jgi:cytoskeleton protein RodZ
LRRARKEAGISVDEISHDLHLDRGVVLALEADDHEFLGAPVFVGGDLRSYARRLHLDEDDVVAGLQVAEPAPEEFRTLSARKEVKLGANFANFLLWVLAGLVALAGLVYLTVGDEPAPATETDKGEFVAPVDRSESALLPDGLELDDRAPDDRAPDDNGQVSSEIEQGAAASAVEEALTDMPAEVVAAGEVAATMWLSFSFTEDCWVELSDAENRLLYGMEKSGAVVTIEGVAPFRLFLGNVNGVSIRAQGQDFPIPRSSLSGNKTARIVITEANVAAVTEQ